MLALKESCMGLSDSEKAYLNSLLLYEVELKGKDELD